MQERNLMETLVAVSPGMEIWWDSSPVIFENFTKTELAKADEGDKETLKTQLRPHVRPRRPHTPALPRRHHQPAPLLAGDQG